MATNIHLLGIAGSLRRQSYNAAALRAAGELLPPRMRLDIIELHDLPMYNQEQDGDNVPESVRAFKQRIADADGLLIATPEYNHSVPGVLKNAIDWASRPTGRSPLNEKPVAIMSVSLGAFGGVRAQGHLRQILVAVNAFTLNQPQVLITHAGQKFDSAGHLTDEATREVIARQLQAFGVWVRRLRGE